MKRIVFFLFLVFSTHVFAGQYRDLSVVVSSCDKYSALWDPFFQLFFKQWPSLHAENKDMPIYLISNHKKYENPRVTDIQIPNEMSWSDNLLQALDKVDTRYVLIVLEDYAFNRPVPEDLLSRQYDFLVKNQGAFLQLSMVNEGTQSFDKRIPEYKIMNFQRHSQFRTSLQAGIWDKNILVRLLKRDESAWDFEKYGSKRSEGVEQLFYASMENTLSYNNLAHLSVLMTDELKYLEEQGIKVDSDLPRDTELKAKWKLKKREALSSVYHKVLIPVGSFVANLF